MSAHYKWDCGLTLRDWRYVIRIANVDTAALTKDAAGGVDLIDLMTQAVEMLPNQSLGRPVWYVNRTVRSFLRRQIMNKAIFQITQEQVAGKRVTMFDGIPVRRVDKISNNEGKIS